MYGGRDDYDQIFEELRADIFGAVAEHEMGHTVGLRHNFQGSYDSLNYHNEYWTLRQENLGRSETLADVYRMNQTTCLLKTTTDKCVSTSIAPLWITAMGTMI